LLWLLTSVKLKFQKRKLKQYNNEFTFGLLWSVWSSLFTRSVVDLKKKLMWSSLFRFEFGWDFATLELNQQQDDHKVFTFRLTTNCGFLHTVLHFRSNYIDWLKQLWQVQSCTLGSRYRAVLVIEPYSLSGQNGT